MAYAAHDSLAVQGSHVASATTTDIGAATGQYIHITGTTTITGFGTKTAGVERYVVFDGSLTLTHNATSLVLPNATNIITVAGDTAIFVSEGSGNWRCLAYQRASRVKLTADRTIYVGAAIPVPTISIATPAVVSSTSHGLSVGDPVVFGIPPSRGTFTMTIASPAVVTRNSHGYAAGQPIQFKTSGALPTGVSKDTTYYVIATGLTGNTFQFSATVGGSAINSSVSQSGTHTVARVGALPTGITEGTIYYVISAGFGANAFQISATPGGSAANTSGSVTGTPTYNGYTGNDANTGAAATRAAALLTPQKAVDLISQTLDLAGKTATVQLADGTYKSSVCGVQQSGPFVGGNPIGTTFPSAGVCPAIVQGNATNPENVTLQSTSADAVLLDAGAYMGIKDLRILSTSGQGLHTGTCASILFGNLILGACGFAKVYAGHSSVIEAFSDYFLEGGAVYVYAAEADGSIWMSGRTETQLTNVATTAYARVYPGEMYIGSPTYVTNGYTFTGKKFVIGLGGSIRTGLGTVSTLPGDAAGTIVDGSYDNMPPATFSAHKNATDQTGIVPGGFVKLTFTTEEFDVGGYYDAANSKWTPPAGSVHIDCTIWSSAGWAASTQTAVLSLYKNGVRYKDANMLAAGASVGMAMSIDDVATGTDYYEVYFIAAGGGSNKTISGTISNSYFSGQASAP